MYQCRENSESKLAQAEYTLKVMKKYRGKVFSNNGLDHETGAYPLQTNISAFLAHTRSAIQYAYKECKTRNTLATYEAAICKRPIIAIFKKLRDTDIHKMSIGTQTVIHIKCILYSTEEETRKNSKKEPEEATIINHITIPIETTEELIEKLRAEGKEGLAVAAEEGKTLYQSVDFEGEEDFFILSEIYIKTIKELLTELVLEKAIT